MISAGISKRAEEVGAVLVLVENVLKYGSGREGFSGTGSPMEPSNFAPVGAFSEREVVIFQKFCDMFRGLSWLSICAAAHARPVGFQDP